MKPFGRTVCELCNPTHLIRGDESVEGLRLVGVLVENTGLHLTTSEGRAHRTLFARATTVEVEGKEERRHRNGEELKDNMINIGTTDVVVEGSFLLCPVPNPA